MVLMTDLGGLVQQLFGLMPSCCRCNQHCRDDGPKSCDDVDTHQVAGDLQVKLSDLQPLNYNMLPHLDDVGLFQRSLSALCSLFLGQLLCWTCQRTC